MVFNIGNSELTKKAIVNLSQMTPATQRFLIGVSALAFVPAIDYFNPCVDKETSKTSALRTAIKVIVYCASGVTARILTQKAGEALVRNGKILVPEGLDRELFTKNVGRILGVVGGILSVFLIDNPFVNKILNAVMKKLPKPNECKPASEGKSQIYA